MAAAVLPPSYIHETTFLPPAYGVTESSTSIQPPTDYLDAAVPLSITVNDKPTPPLVLPSDLYAHTILLGAFYRLREEVLTQKGGSDLALDANDRWTVFLARAVYRFQCWVERVMIEPEQDIQTRGVLRPDDCPPLDVVMVWLVYMLNPRTYYEDGLRYNRGLEKIGSFPLKQLAALIDAESLLPHPPTSSRRTSFETLAGQPFQYAISVTSGDTLTVNCPSCSLPNTVPWASLEGNGYSQKDFACTCTDAACGLNFGHEALCVRKFCEDVEKATLKPKSSFLSGTLVDNVSGQPNPDAAEVFTMLILETKGTSEDVALRPEVLGAQLNWSFLGVEGYCRKGFLGRKNKPFISNSYGLNRVLRGYWVNGPFSIELTSAIVRQMSFVDKIYQLGWLEPGRYEDDKSGLLVRSVVRYHGFLDLMAASPGRFVVPTLDIDLAWHTHQLMVDSYRTLFDLIGVIPDHDDKVEQTNLSNSYDETAKQWKARFGVPYSACGCLPPTTKEKTSSSLSSMFSRKGKSKAPQTPISTALPDNPRPDLLSLEESDAMASHPSDHNSTHVLDKKKEYVWKSDARAENAKARASDLAKTVAKSKTGDPWSTLLLKRGNNAEHDPAYLVPITDDMFQRSEYGLGECTTHEGHILLGTPIGGQCTVGFGREGMCHASYNIPRQGLMETVRYSFALQNGTRGGDFSGFTGPMYLGLAACGGGGGCGGGCGGS